MDLLFPLFRMNKRRIKKLLSELNNEIEKADNRLSTKQKNDVITNSKSILKKLNSNVSKLNTLLSS